MNKYLCLISIGILFVVGCNNATTNKDIVRLNTNSETKNVSSVNKNITESNNQINNSDKETSIIDKAQKDYQDSYNEYVKCLRESGPQTIETLQALTIYQKNYQIYQMLLKAESQK